MPVPVKCVCGLSMRVKDEYVGRRARCPSCKRVIEVADRNQLESLELVAEPAPVEEKRRRGRSRDELEEMEEVEEVEPVTSRRLSRDDEDEDGRSRRSRIRQGTDDV